MSLVLFNTEENLGELENFKLLPLGMIIGI